MIEYKTEEIEGECPYINNNITTAAKYQKMQAIGSPTPGAACVRFMCEYEEECPYIKDKSCPLYIKASSLGVW